MRVWRQDPGGSYGAAVHPRGPARAGGLAVAVALVLHGTGIAAGGPPAYVVNQRSGDLTVVDTALRQPSGEIAVGSLPAAVLFSPLGRFAHVAVAGEPEDDGPGSLVLVDVAIGEIIGEVAVGDAPVGVAASRDGRLLAVANTGRPSVSDGTVSLIDVAALLAGEAEFAALATVAVGGDPGGIALDPEGRFAYVTNNVLVEDNVVFVVDLALALVAPGAAVVGEIQVGNSPLGIAVTADGTRAYVANFAFGSNTVSVVDLEARVVVREIVVGSRPAGVAIAPDGRFAYVSNFISNTVSVIETATNRVRATVDVGQAPQGLAFSFDGGTVYVANRQSIGVTLPGTVSVVDTAVALSNPRAAVVAEVDAGDNPIAVALAGDALAALVRGLFVPSKPVDGDLNGDGRVTVADLPALLAERGS